jgi:lipopolysaccharide biosynthesis glycosyltransferase
MKPAPKLIDIAFGIDTAYAPHLAAAIASIVANASGGQFRFMVIHDGVPESDQKKIESCAPGHFFIWPQITDTTVTSLAKRNHISRASYYRFSIPDFAPADATRVIYLDSDLIVLGDLRQLFEAELANTLLGAVFDPAVEAEGFAKRWDLNPVHLAYFNAGVLLLDVAKIRASGAFDKAFDLITGYWDDLEFGDQDVLNLLFWDKWTRLEPVWNVQRRMVMREGTPCYATRKEMQTDRRPKIIHFTETNKPWAVDAFHPFVWTYYRYLRRTPYWKSVNGNARSSPLKHLRRYLKTTFNLALLKR